MPVSLTVADCLKLPSLKKGEVVSGHKGLSKIVYSVSVLEFIDPVMVPDGRVFAPSEIVLSAFASVKDDVTAQCETIELLARSGTVALVLYYVGFQMLKVHPRLIEKGNQMDFPIIVMPESQTGVLYSDAITDIMEAIFYSKQREKRLTNVALKRIAQFPEHQRTLDNVMRMLSDQLRCSLLLVDIGMNCLQFQKRPLSGLESEDAILELFSGRKAVKGVEMGFEEMNYTDEVMVYKLPFSERLFQHLSLIAVDEFSSLTREDLYSAMEVIQLYSSIWKQPIDSMRPGALISAALNDNASRVERIADALNVNMETMNTMLFLQIEDGAMTLHNKHEAGKKLSAAVRRKLTSFDKPPIATAYNSLMVIAMLPFSADSEEDSQLISELREEAQSLCGRVSFALCTNLINTKSMRNAFVLFSDNIQTARIIYPAKEVVTASDLQFAAECSQITDRGEQKAQYYHDTLDLLRKREDGQELLSTLTAYLLDGGGNARITGQMLFVHRNTVQYRLNKIRQILNLDYEISKMPEAYAVYKTAALSRLLSSYEE